MKPVWWLAFAILGLGMAQDLGSLEEALRQAQELRESRAREAQEVQSQINDLAGKSQALAQDLSRLEAEITTLERERREIELRIAELQQEIAALELSIGENETKREQLSARMQQLLNNLYRERASRYLPVLQAESFVDLAVRNVWVNRLGESDVKLADQLATTISTLQSQRDELTVRVQELSSQQEARAQKIAALSSNRDQVDRTLVALQAEQAGQQVALGQILNTQKSLDQEMNSLQGRIEAERQRLEQERLAAERQAREEAQRRAEEEARQQAAAEAAARAAQEAARPASAPVQPVTPPAPVASAPVKPVTPPPAPPVAAVVRPAPPPSQLNGRFMVPLEGGSIVASYGSEGRDFQTVVGGRQAPVKAAADGTVFATMFYGNIGWVVVVQHTGELFTQYVNLTNPVVSEGQKVTRGQTLGNLGGGILIPQNTLWFRAALYRGGNFQYVDPGRYY